MGGNFIFHGLYIFSCNIIKFILLPYICYFSNQMEAVSSMTWNENSENHEFN